MSDSLLSLDQSAFDDLQRFLAEPKFLGEGFYPEPSAEVREEAQSLVDELVGRLISGLAQHPTKAFVLGEFKTTMKAFDAHDSEEQDRLMEYLAQLLDILGIESSDGTIGAWRYGNFEAANDP